MSEINIYTTKWLRQPHTRTCGPTAITNAMKWAGCQYATKTHAYKWICTQYNHVLESGMHGFEVEKAARFYLPTGVTVSLCTEKVGETVVDHLGSAGPDGAAVFVYWYEEKGEVVGHYSFALGLDQRFDTMFLVNNIRHGATLQQVPVSKFKHITSKYTDEEGEFALLLQK